MYTEFRMRESPVAEEPKPIRSSTTPHQDPSYNLPRVAFLHRRFVRARMFTEPSSSKSRATRSLHSGMIRSRHLLLLVGIYTQGGRQTSVDGRMALDIAPSQIFSRGRTPRFLPYA